jgi:hypothetical protein
VTPPLLINDMSKFAASIEVRRQVQITSYNNNIISGSDLIKSNNAINKLNIFPDISE